MSVRSSRKEICKRAVHQIRPQMFQNERRARTASCGATFPHSPLSIAISIRMDFISWVALNCRMRWVSEAFCLYPGLVNNSGGYQLKLPLLLLLLVEELVQTKHNTVTFFITVQSWFRDRLFGSYLP